MMWQNLTTRLISVFVASAIPNVAVGAAVGVDLWQSTVMSGAIAVLAVIQRVAVAYRNDGVLTQDEIDEAFRSE